VKMWPFYLWLQTKSNKEGEQYWHKGVICLKCVLVPIGVFVIIGLLSGFQQDKSILEQGLPAEKTLLADISEDREPAMFVQYESKGNNVFVECIVTGVTFRESAKNKRKVGKMIVWVDGKKSKEVSTAAFIIKDLATGNHVLKLEMVDLHNKSYGISKEFMVNIPNN
jgi:hypothetical protein